MLAEKKNKEAEVRLSKSDASVIEANAPAALPAPAAVAAAAPAAAGSDATLYGPSQAATKADSQIAEIQARINERDAAAALEEATPGGTGWKPEKAPEMQWHPNAKKGFQGEDPYDRWDGGQLVEGGISRKAREERNRVGQIEADKKAKDEADQALISKIKEQLFSPILAALQSSAESGKAVANVLTGAA
jgi:hypothetical protein